jgi:HlyD family secretion protein
MQVYRGQLLCEIADLDALELSVQVDELDLASLRVGDVLTYTLDAYVEETFSGTVMEIRPIGMARQNATYFDVRLTISTERMVLPGMNGTVTLDK